MKKSLKLTDVVLLNFVAIISLRWTATAAAIGPVSLSLWILAVLFFFIPQAFAVAELSSRYPGEGGLYRWTKLAFGDYHGFLCGWCYWVNNLLYFPSLLLYVSTNFAYFLHTLHPEWHGEQSKILIVTITLVSLWVVSAISIFGMRLGKWVQDLGALATWVPVISIFVLATLAYHFYGSANALSFRDLIPQLHHFPQLSFFSQLCFALAGLELVSFFGSEVDNPRRNIPLAILISGGLITAVYWLVTLGILVSVPLAQITPINGILLPLEQLGMRFHVGWVAGLCGILIAASGIAGTAAWFSGAAKIPYLVGVDRYLPASFGKLHPKFETPYLSILTQTVLATLLTLFATAGSETKLETVYKVLVDMCLILYFIPYCYLFLSSRKLSATNDLLSSYRIPGGKLGNRILNSLGFLATALAIITTLLPSGLTLDLSALLKVVLGTSLMIAMGAWLYHHSAPSHSNVVASKS